MEGRKVRAAAIQMSSTPDKEENKATAEALIREAVAAGAEPVPGPTTDFLGDLARELGVYLLGGSILEGEPGAERLSSTATFFDPSGEFTAVYRKIHLFDVKVSDREYLESANISPGTEIVTAKAGAATLGLSVCYDVRFPELYRLLALRGAEILAALPAVTPQTGK